MRNSQLIKFFISILAALVIVSAIIFGDIIPNFTRSKKSIEKELAAISNPKVKQIFCLLQNDSQDIQSCLNQVGPLTQNQINIAYETAVKHSRYDLALKFYQMGADNCDKEGQDILWVSICLGDLDLAQKLLQGDCEMHLYHINAIRSLINLDQPNWAYIYKKEDVDTKGFEKYQQKVQEVAEEIVVKYKEQNKREKIPFPRVFQAHKRYELLFGKESKKAFEKLVEQTLSEDYSFEYAKHGSQKTQILVNSQGKKIAIIKSQNELFAQAVDQDHFAGVPPVIEANILGKGKVVLQKWLEGSLIATEYNYLPMQTFLKMPNVLEELHHIRALDIRLGNSDRNRGNVLVKKIGESFHVVPIDHDLIHHYIPSDISWESLYLNIPFTDITAQKILSINLKKDEEIMKSLSYKKEEIKTMKLRTTILKMCVEKKLSLKQIDILFRFFYYDFLDEVTNLSEDASERQYREKLAPLFEKTSQTIQKTSEVWKLFGNNFEFYI